MSIKRPENTVTGKKMDRQISPFILKPELYRYHSIGTMAYQKKPVVAWADGAVISDGYASGTHDGIRDGSHSGKTDFSGVYMRYALLEDFLIAGNEEPSND